MDPDPQPAPRRRVVIATGEPAIARIIGHKLRREGHEVASVATAQGLEEMLEGRTTDVALVDLLLAGGGATGIGDRVACGWLAIVDGRSPELAERAMHAGAAGLVRTPFKPTEVATQVATLLTLIRR